MEIKLRSTQEYREAQAIASGIRALLSGAAQLASALKDAGLGEGAIHREMNKSGGDVEMRDALLGVVFHVIDNNKKP